MSASSPPPRSLFLGSSCLLRFHLPLAAKLPPKLASPSTAAEAPSRCCPPRLAWGFLSRRASSALCQEEPPQPCRWWSFGKGGRRGKGELLVLSKKGLWLEGRGVDWLPPGTHSRWKARFLSPERLAFSCPSAASHPAWVAVRPQTYLDPRGLSQSSPSLLPPPTWILSTPRGPSGAPSPASPFEPLCLFSPKACLDLHPVTLAPSFFVPRLKESGNFRSRNQFSPWFL